MMVPNYLCLLWIFPVSRKICYPIWIRVCISESNVVQFWLLSLCHATLWERETKGRTITKVMGGWGVPKYQKKIMQGKIKWKKKSCMQSRPGKKFLQWPSTHFAKISRRHAGKHTVCKNISFLNWNFWLTFRLVLLGKWNNNHSDTIQCKELLRKAAKTCQFMTQKVL